LIGPNIFKTDSIKVILMIEIPKLQKIHKMKSQMYQHMMPKDIRPIRPDLTGDFKGMNHHLQGWPKNILKHRPSV